MSMLELRRVSKVYGQGAAEVHALREVSLEVEAGTMVAVMGPSGSGKSTLLTIAGSLEEPSSGQVLVAGRDLAAMSRNDRARLRRQSIGYVFQDFNLLPGLTAAENVALPLELDGVGARKAREAGLRALDGLGLADRASSYPDLLLAGLVAVIAGIVLLAPLAVSVLAAGAGPRLPVAIRIALRDLVRYRARSGAALAATTFAVFAAMGICLVASVKFDNPLNWTGPSLSGSQLRGGGAHDRDRPRQQALRQGHGSR